MGGCGVLFGAHNFYPSTLNPSRFTISVRSCEEKGTVLISGTTTGVGRNSAFATGSAFAASIEVGRNRVFADMLFFIDFEFDLECFELEEFCSIYFFFIGFLSIIFFFCTPC